MVKSLQERFFAKVKIEASGCHVWIGGKNRWGYGKFRIGKRTVSAHRTSWEIHKGPIPDQMCVLHKCDNRPCVNPDHLWLGTKADNNRDRDVKGRLNASGRKGEQHGMAKINEDIVRHIRTSTLKSATLSRTLGISESIVRSVRKFRTWKEVK